MFVLLVALGVNHARQIPVIVWLASSPSTRILLILKFAIPLKIAHIQWDQSKQLLLCVLTQLTVQQELCLLLSQLKLILTGAPKELCVQFKIKVSVGLAGHLLWLRTLNRPTLSRLANFTTFPSSTQFPATKATLVAVAAGWKCVLSSWPKMDAYWSQIILIKVALLQ